MSGGGLEEIGIPGKEYLRKALTSCSDPLKAISDFQAENGILLPSLRPMLPLLDLHGVKRFEFHTSVMESLCDKLIQQINDIGKLEGRERDRKLRDLLHKSFPVIRFKTLRPIVMAILKHTREVDHKFLKVLVRDKELYNDLDTEVKRQIWTDHQTLFGDEVSPLFIRYVQQKEAALLTHTNLNNFFDLTPKVRRQGEIIQKIVHMIGHSVKLYDMVLQFLRTLFVKTRNVHYCTLRAELLMALHDLEIQEIVDLDPCHKFTWCLDACIRERSVDTKRGRELQGFLDSIKKGNEQILSDLSMILCDPFAVNFLATSALKILTQLINSEGMPRDHAVLLLLLRMLELGLHAWDMIDRQEFREPRLDPQVVTKFVPSLVSLIVDDQVRALNQRLPPDERASAITIIEHSGPPPDAYQAYITESSVACLLAVYYTLQTARSRDRVGLMRVLGCLSASEGDRAFEDTFLHSLVTLLIGMSDELATEDFCTVIFDEFFFTALSKENVVQQLGKLLWHTHAKLPTARRDTLMQALHHQPNLRPLLEQLREKMERDEGDVEMPPPAPPVDSPLMSVPTPAPHRGDYP
ncbi:negative elongation factor B-like [Amphibalanus amphitrite]|uniref:negative elongation factor B-like n=1 Tax=Amphibalanus amphitrite TaxID=1232801 RepID=UPI001C8FEBBC|nr:negative elongation factor B-like [Amphibalanus amphitrite]XP_043207190.1 negative elongation factor B-like [Amphibalanus amphitrite]XP_043207191.1 negative elongation factor B-like [Amphibalanus amphitrite]XP_043207192.1 negative elongation factor B-like [Amphibalanus amphitrite]XP_043207194.1 negative elongation factor B-like [Amphibalanus amphitrite]XP_043207195.1 negative elongation factor B-like [Amphibalanus amphitrite]XP_043207196.1 negative elongation factor B-like [Amphibalanus am